LLSVEFIRYDDACHLRKYAENPVRAGLTAQTKQLASVQMVVDKMHMKGHTDHWCKVHCDPAKFQALRKVFMQFTLILMFYSSVMSSVPTAGRHRDMRAGVLLAL